MNARERVASIWTTGSTEAIHTGTWRAALAQHIEAPSPCHAACPVHGDIAEWIGQARACDFRAAWQTLMEHNPFPAIAGRICHHPCESACNRSGHDAALSICKLERFVGDEALRHGWSCPAPPMQRSERIAVVGGGPSGLSAAYQLRRLGYTVTLFEAQPELGGLMRYGIPAYRLAREVLDGEIARLLALGVEVRRSQAVTTAAALAQLRSEYDALYLALGAGRPKRLAQLDYRRPWAIDGAQYLARASAGAPPALGQRVVVIGGGSAALDVARTARRAGHQVSVLALEARGDMPAQREEVVEALEEGITLVDSAGLRAVVELASAGLRLHCTRVCFEAGAPGRRFTVTELAGGDFTLEADAIVSAIGQDPDLSALAGAFEVDGALLRTDDRGATSAATVWAGGDMASMGRYVTEAIGMGERAALAIDRALCARSGAPRPSQTASQVEALVPLAAINLHYHPVRARASERRVGVEQRLAPLGAPTEVQLGLDLAQALDEAARCFSCGLCIDCDNCISYCPDFAVQRAGDAYLVLTDYCKGCGLCVRECPTGSMKMQEELR